MNPNPVGLLSVLVIPLNTAACGGDCISVGVSRPSSTERRLRVGESFVATYEEGGVCGEPSLRRPVASTWATAERDILQVDSPSPAT